MFSFSICGLTFLNRLLTLLKSQLVILLTTFVLQTSSAVACDDERSIQEPPSRDRGNVPGKGV